MLLLECVASTVCDDNDVGQRSGHRPAKQQKITIDYMHKHWWRKVPKSGGVNQLTKQYFYYKKLKSYGAL